MPNLIRPDGTVTSATDAQAEKLLKLGYKLEAPEQLENRAREQVVEESFSTPGQKLLTGLEGVASGLTLSASDLLTDDASTRARARYNPGTRIGGEIAGAVLPALVTAGATVPESGAEIGGSVAKQILRGALKSTPTGIVGRLGGESVLAGAAIEGAAMGGAGEVTQATLSGEPVLAENVLAGMGWGTLYGTGLGIAAVGLGRGIKALGKYDSVAEKSLLDTDAHIAVKARMNEATDAYETVLARAKAAKSTADIYGKQLDELEAFAPHVLTEVDPHRALMAEADLVNAMKKDPATVRLMAEGRMDSNSIAALRKRLSGADPDVTRLENPQLAKLLAKYDREAELVTKAQAVNERMAAENLQNTIRIETEKKLMGEQFNTAKKAFNDNTKLALALKEVRNFPDAPEKFLAMKNPERIWGSVDTIMSTNVSGFDGLKAGLKDSIEKLTSKAGLDLSGKSPATQLREVWRTARDAQLATPAAAKVKKDQHWASGVMSQISGRLASQGAGKLGFGAVGKGAAFFGGKTIILDGVLGLAGQVRNKIGAAVTKMEPVAKKLAPVVAGKTVPLAISVLGRPEKSSGDMRSLAKTRIDEINALAPTIKEGAFKVVEPFIEEHTDFGYNLFNSLVNAFTGLQEMMPKDSGTAFSGMQSLWKPSDVQAYQMNSIYEVFQTPVAVAESMVTNLGKRPIQAVQIEAMKRMYPEVYSQLRSAVMERLMEDGANFDYATQMQISLLIDTPTHSSFTPESIAASQALYQVQPQQSKPGTSGGGGRPASVEPPTPGQILYNGGGPR